MHDSAGPVYKVKWSPFVNDCFLTCGSDWTIRLWHTDLTKPVLTFVSSTKSVNDICWSTVCATVFGAVSDNRYRYTFYYLVASYIDLFSIYIDFIWYL